MRKLILRYLIFSHNLIKFFRQRPPQPKEISPRAQRPRPERLHPRLHRCIPQGQVGCSLRRENRRVPRVRQSHGEPSERRVERPLECPLGGRPVQIWSRDLVTKWHRSWIHLERNPRHLWPELSLFYCKYVTWLLFISTLMLIKV